MTIIKKRIIKIFIFLLILLTLFLYTNKMFETQWHNVNNGFQKTEEYLGLPDDTADVLFLGSSGLYAGISPARLWDNTSITSYNLSVSTHNFFSRYFELKQILEERDISLLITDLSYIFNPTNPYSEKTEINYKYGFSSMKKLGNKNEYINTLETEYPDINIFEYWMPLSKHHVNWDKFQEDKFLLDNDNIILGSLHSVYIDPISYKINNSILEINEIELKYFNKLLDLAKEKNVEVLGIIPPRSITEVNKNDFLKELSNQKNIKFLDFTTENLKDEVQVNPQTDFYDVGHVNILGNRKLTDFLGEYILENYHNVRVWKESDEDYEKTKIWRDASFDYERQYKKMEDKSKK